MSFIPIQTQIKFVALSFWHHKFVPPWTETRRKKLRPVLSKPNGINTYPKSNQTPHAIPNSPEFPLHVAYDSHRLAVTALTANVSIRPAYSFMT